MTALPSSLHGPLADAARALLDQPGGPELAAELRRVARALQGGEPTVYVLPLSRAPRLALHVGPALELIEEGCVTPLAAAGLSRGDRALLATRMLERAEILLMEAGVTTTSSAAFVARLRGGS